MRQHERQPAYFQTITSIRRNGSFPAASNAKQSEAPVLNSWAGTNWDSVRASPILTVALACVIAAIWQLKMAKTKAMVTKKAQPDPGPSTSCDINGVGREWYNVEEVRDRIMEGGSVLAPNTPLKQEDIQVCVMNQDLLVPILSRMCTTQNRALPGIDDLRDQVSTLLTLCKRSGDLVGIVEDTAGTLKKLSGFVKTKTRRREVFTVTWQHPEDKAGDWNFHNFLYVYSIDRQRTNALKNNMNTFIFGCVLLVSAKWI